MNTYKSALNNPTKETELFKKLVTDLKAENEEVMLNHFDFVSFFESKNKGITMAKILSEKK